jgi:predicted nicotinamide N-methyase
MGEGEFFFTPALFDDHAAAVEDVVVDGVGAVRLMSVGRALQHAAAAEPLIVWPAAHVLSDLLVAMRASLCGKTVLELGAGTGTPPLSAPHPPGIASIVAAALGASVVATDGDGAAVENIRRNVALNSDLFRAHPPPSVAQLRWGDVETLERDFPRLDLLVASDVMSKGGGGSDFARYAASSLQPLIATVAAALRLGATALVVNNASRADKNASLFDAACAGGGVVCKRRAVECRHERAAETHLFEFVLPN